jgi:hypothetical protein
MKTQHLRFGDMYADVPDFLGIADGMANNGEINQEYGLEQLDPEDQDVMVIVKDVEPTA